jgi:hypothetical protein
MQLGMKIFFHKKKKTSSVGVLNRTEQANGVVACGFDSQIVGDT